MGRSLIFSVIGLSITVGLVHLGIQGRQKLINERNIESIYAEQALAVANSATETVLNQLRVDPNWKNGGDTLKITLGSGSAKAIIEDSADDPSISASPKEVRITVWGNYEDRTHQTITIAQQTNLSLPNIDGAMSVYSESNRFQLDVQGSGFNIDGNDTNLDGTPGPEPALPGLHTSSNLTRNTILNSSRSKISPAELDSIKGRGYIAGSTPSVEVDPSLVQPDFEQLVKDFKANATRRYNDEVEIEHSVTWGTPTSPEVVYINSEEEMEIEGSLTGYGILIINAEEEDEDEFLIDIRNNLNWTGLVILSGEHVDLKIRNGDFNLNGLLYVTGHRALNRNQNRNSNFDIRNGSFNLNGSMAFGQQGKGRNPRFNMRVRNDLDVKYSSEAINIANNLITTYSTSGAVSYFITSVYE